MPPRDLPLELWSKILQELPATDIKTLYQIQPIWRIIKCLFVLVIDDITEPSQCQYFKDILDSKSVHVRSITDVSGENVSPNKIYLIEAVDYNRYKTQLHSFREILRTGLASHVVLNRLSDEYITQELQHHESTFVNIHLKRFPGCYFIFNDSEKSLFMEELTAVDPKRLYFTQGLDILSFTNTPITNESPCHVHASGTNIRHLVLDHAVNETLSMFDFSSVGNLTISSAFTGVSLKDFQSLQRIGYRRIVEGNWSDDDEEEEERDPFDLAADLALLGEEAIEEEDLYRPRNYSVFESLVFPECQIWDQPKFVSLERLQYFKSLTLNSALEFRAELTDTIETSPFGLTLRSDYPGFKILRINTDLAVKTRRAEVTLDFDSSCLFFIHLGPYSLRHFDKTPSEITMNLNVPCFINTKEVLCLICEFVSGFDSLFDLSSPSFYNLNFLSLSIHTEKQQTSLNHVHFPNLLSFRLYNMNPNAQYAYPRLIAPRLSSFHLYQIESNCSLVGISNYWPSLESLVIGLSSCNNYKITELDQLNNSLKVIDFSMPTYWTLKYVFELFKGTIFGALVSLKITQSSHPGTELVPSQPEKKQTKRVALRIEAPVLRSIDIITNSEITYELSIGKLPNLRKLKLDIKWKKLILEDSPLLHTLNILGRPSSGEITSMVELTALKVLYLRHVYSQQWLDSLVDKIFMSDHSRGSLLSGFGDGDSMAILADMLGASTQARPFWYESLNDHLFDFIDHRLIKGTQCDWKFHVSDFQDFVMGAYGTGNYFWHSTPRIAEEYYRYLEVTHNDRLIRLGMSSMTQAVGRWDQ
ncbi:hypothetical protein WICPIJ_005535 [Wickerhamomyces pijperi]|uniref:F-box domain-containing protein n=1 Tax=Wickerhamomyces pijperi TaxID=599730 RepID=A0A9P8Q5J8_WICPI|nr:hypothetical protein WICPIJ_005535 [Wickerhamomyces pijperi]